MTLNRNNRVTYRQTAKLFPGSNSDLPQATLEIVWEGGQAFSRYNKVSHLTIQLGSHNIKIPLPSTVDEQQKQRLQFHVQAQCCYYLNLPTAQLPDSLSLVTSSGEAVEVKLLKKNLYYEHYKIIITNQGSRLTATAINTSQGLSNHQLKFTILEALLNTIINNIEQSQPSLPKYNSKMYVKKVKEALSYQILQENMNRTYKECLLLITEIEDSKLSNEKVNEKLAIIILGTVLFIKEMGGASYNQASIRNEILDYGHRAVITGEIPFNIEELQKNEPLSPALLLISKNSIATYQKEQNQRAWFIKMYQEQVSNRASRHSSRSWFVFAMTIFPPLSLFVTLPQIIKSIDAKDLIKNIFIAVFSALTPISLLAGLAYLNRSKAKDLQDSTDETLLAQPDGKSLFATQFDYIRKISLSRKEYEENKKNFPEMKDKQLPWKASHRVSGQAQAKKPRKAIVIKKDTVDLYMDYAAARRYGIYASGSLVDLGDKKEYNKSHWASRMLVSNKYGQSH
jgi:hypothetical protein